jgi:hypothetical protein
VYTPPPMNQSRRYSFQLESATLNGIIYPMADEWRDFVVRYIFCSGRDPSHKHLRQRSGTADGAAHTAGTAKRMNIGSHARPMRNSTKITHQR